MGVKCQQLQLRAACEGLNNTDAMLPLGELANTATIPRPSMCGYPDLSFANGTFR